MDTRCWLVTLVPRIMSPTFRGGIRSLYVQRAFVLGGLLVAFPDLATAQANASLLGTVTDETGAVLAGAEISIRHASTNLERLVRTTSTGRYQLWF